MTAKKKSPVVRREEQITPLTDIISSLDSVRAYRRRSSQNLEEKFKRLGGMGYPELRKMWFDIEDDVKAIVDMPNKVPKVPSMIRANYALKLSSRIFFILLVLEIAARYVRIWRSSLGELLGDNTPFLLFVVFGAIATMNGEIIVDFMIRRRIVQYERDTEDRYKKNVLTLQKAAQATIDALAREIRHSGKKPEDFPFYIFFDDYRGVEITSSKTPRSMFFFKRKYKVHYAVVKLT